MGRHRIEYILNINEKVTLSLSLHESSMNNSRTAWKHILDVAYPSTPNLVRLIYGKIEKSAKCLVAYDLFV